MKRIRLKSGLTKKKDNRPKRFLNRNLFGAPNQLNRKFKYDPLNRLLEAAGREDQNASGEDKWGNVAKGTQQDATTGNPGPSAMQAYTCKYTYDKMGNIEQLKQPQSISRRQLKITQLLEVAFNGIVKFRKSF